MPTAKNMVVSAVDELWAVGAAAKRKGEPNGNEVRTVVHRKQRKGFTLVEIMIVVSIIILLAAIAVPGFIRARQRTQGSTTLNGARQLDAAIEQWATEYGKANGAAITLASLAPYVKPGSLFQVALSAGNTPTDALNHAYVFGTVGSGQVTVSSATKTALTGVMDWSPY